MGGEKAENYSPKGKGNYSVLKVQKLLGNCMKEQLC